MSMKIPEGEKGEAFVKALGNVGLEVVGKKGKSGKHKIYQLHLKTTGEVAEGAEAPKGKKVSPHEAVALLAARIAKLNTQLATVGLEGEGAAKLKEQLQQMKGAHDLLQSGALDHHTWTDRAKEGAIIVAASPFVLSMLLLTGIAKTVLGTGALLNRGLFLAVDKAKVQLGDKETKEVEMQAVKAYDNLRWGMLNKKGPPDYLAATKTLYKQQSFIDSISENSAFITKAANDCPSDVKEKAAFAKIIAKKMNIYLQTGEFKPFTEKEWKKIRPDMTGENFANISDALNKYVKNTLIAQLDKSYQVYTPDPNKEAVFNAKLFELMGRKNNFLIFALTGGFRATPPLATPRVNDQTFSIAGNVSSLKYQAQKALQGTSNRALKQSLASGTSATAIIQLIEQPGFVKRISKGLLEAVANSPLDKAGKELVYQALFENCTDDRGREKIFAKVGKEVAAKFIAAQMKKVDSNIITLEKKGKTIPSNAPPKESALIDFEIDVLTQEKKHLTLLALQTGNAELIQQTTGIDIKTVDATAIRENEAFFNLLMGDASFASKEGQTPIFYALRSGNMRLTVAVAQAMGDPNPYLQADSRGRKPVHYMTREQATWLDNHYHGASGKPLDGSQKGSFTAVMDRFDALRFQGTHTRMVMGAIVGKMAGSAISTSLILATHGAPAHQTIKEIVTSALEIQGPVYGGLVGGAFITIPLQKFMNNMYVIYKGLDLDLGQYDKRAGVHYGEVPSDNLPKQNERPESLGTARNKFTESYTQSALQGNANLQRGAARKAISDLSKDWKMALNNKDPIAIAYLIQLSGKDITLSRSKLKQLADINYFPDVKDAEGNRVDTRKIIGDFVLEQNEKRVEAANKEGDIKKAAKANSQASNDIQDHFEKMIETGGKAYVAQAIIDWATSAETVAYAQRSSGGIYPKEYDSKGNKIGEGLFTTPMYKAALATAIKMGDTALLAELRKLDAHIDDDQHKPLFLAYGDKDGAHLYNLAAMSKNAKMMMDVKEMMFLGREDIEGTVNYKVEGDKQQAFYMSYGGIEMNPHALIARITGRRSVDWNPDNLKDGKGRTVADIVDKDTAAEFDRLQGHTEGSQQTLSNIANTRKSRQLEKLSYTGLIGLPAGKTALYLAVANTIDMAVIAAGAAGLATGGPVGGFFAAYATHVLTGVAVIGVTVLLATAVGEGAEGAVAGLETIRKGYDNRTGFAYGASGQEIRDNLKEAQKLAKLSPDIAKAAEDASKRVIYQALTESVESLGVGADDATKAKIAKFLEISGKIMALNSPIGPTTRLLMEAAANLQLTPLQAKTLNDNLVERIGVYSGVTAKKVTDMPEVEFAKHPEVAIPQFGELHMGMQGQMGYQENSA